MRHLKYILYLLYSLMVISGCSHRRICQEIEKLSENAIYLPTSLQIIQNGQISKSVSQKLGGEIKLIYYNDSNGCTPCRVGHLYDLETLFELDLQKRFVPFIIFSPKDSSQYQELVCLLNQYSFGFPVYVDVLNEFKQRNALLPSDTRLHTFLLDKNNRVVLVGNPLASDKIWSLFESTLDNMLAHDGVYVPEK